MNSIERDMLEDEVSRLRGIISEARSLVTSLFALRGEDYEVDRLCELTVKKLDEA